MTETNEPYNPCRTIYFVLNLAPPVYNRSLTEPKLREAFVWHPEYWIYQLLLTDVGNNATNAPFW